MQIILVPGPYAKMPTRRIGPGRVAIASIALVLVLLCACALTAAASFWLYPRLHPAPDPFAFNANQPVASADVQAHLDAMAKRLADLQAELARVNAVGARVAAMAHLDQREFDFSRPAPEGGPESKKDLRPMSMKELSSSLTRLSYQYDNRALMLDELVRALQDKKLVRAATPRTWPVNGGWISSGFGRRTDPFTGRLSFHPGIDIAKHEGARIHALAAGIVTFAGSDHGYGNMVEIAHYTGIVTRYGHAEKLLVKKGDTVTAGQVIALMGSTGRSTGPHVHLEVWRGGKLLNPLTVLRHHGPYLVRARHAGARS